MSPARHFVSEVEIEQDRLAARGVAIGSSPVPYRLDYNLETGPAFVTERLAVTVRGDGWMRSLDLRRSPSGVWQEAWKEDGMCRILGLRGATDLEGSPSTMQGNENARP
jgi:hypothetical protein